MLEVLVNSGLLSSGALLAHGSETTLSLRGRTVEGTVEVSITLVVFLL
jgi:hypothetical protein